MKLKPLERVVKVVVDTNVVVSAAIAKDSNPAKIFELLLLEAIDNFTTDEIVDEITDVLNRPKIRALLSLVDRKFVINKFKEFSKRIKIGGKLNVIKEDKDDNKFLDCALKARADYIISGDTHLKSLKEFKGVKICSPKQFLDKFSL